MNQEEEIPLFGRPLSAHPLGKRTHVVRSTVPEAVGEKLTAAAIQLGIAESEVVCDILSRWGFKDLMATLDERRRQVTEGNLSGIGQDGE